MKTKKSDKIYEQLKHESEMRQFNNMFKSLRGFGFIIIALLAIVACEPEEEVTPELQRTSIMTVSEDTSEVVNNPSTIIIPEGTYVQRYVDTEDSHGVMSYETNLIMGRGIFTQLVYVNGDLADSTVTILSVCVQIGTSDIYAFEKFYQNNHTSHYIFYKAGTDYVIDAFFNMSVDPIDQILDYESFSNDNSKFIME